MSELYQCDGCGKKVPIEEVAIVSVCGCEGDFCEECRGVKGDYDE